MWHFSLKVSNDESNTYLMCVVYVYVCLPWSLSWSSAIKTNGGWEGLEDGPTSSISLIGQLFLITWGLVHTHIHTRCLHTLQKHFNCCMLWPWLPPPVRTLNQPYGPSDPLPLSPSISAAAQLFNNLGSGCWISNVAGNERWAGIRFALDGQLDTL